VLPSIAEVGGRVRFTAEVIDPKTQTTVYSDYADGVGVESVLPSVDAVNRDLRQRLGEALANVSADSKPLARVVTAKFDALRAYSLAVSAEQENRLADALALLERALEVDPEFATARLKRGVVMLNTGNRSGALRELREAEKFQDRVSARDRFVLAATIASLTATPRENIEKWRVLADLYPDFFPAQNTYGFYAWQGANAFAEAIPALERSIASQNPMRGSGHYVLGSVLLAANRYADALAQFALYEQTGRRFENQFYAATYAAQRQFDKIDEILDRGQASGIAGSDVPGLVVRAAFALDQGDFRQAQRLLVHAGERGQAASWRHARMADAIALTYSALVDPVKQQRERIGTFLDVELGKEIGSEDPGAGIDRQRRLLLAAWLAARIEDRSLARRAMAAVDDNYIGNDYPELTQRHAVAMAERLRSEGESAAAIERLAPLAASNGFYSARVALMDALMTAGEFDQARRLGQWLATNRGVAYGEMHGDHMMQLFNVGESNLALLALAEQALALRQPRDARRELDAFLHVWREDALPATIAARVEAVRAKLPEAGQSPEPPPVPEIKS
jgi:putative peptide modification system cyclase